MGAHPTILAFGGQWGWGAWSWLVFPIGCYVVISLGLFIAGRAEVPDPTGYPVRFFFGNIADSLQRATGFPGWSMAGVLSGLASLWVLVDGFYWDVGWHIDNGRDTQLFTASHVMILVGLAGLIYTAALATLFANLEHADAGLRLGPVRVPWSAVLLFALGAGAIAGFPLDNLWHQAFGIDVTLWSPTHLQLVGGGSFATIALLLMCAEALPAANPTRVGRAILVLTGGSVLVGMSTFQAEFDFGVPQFQVLYLPLLIAAAAGFALVIARVALGRWGAVKVVFVYLALRGVLALIVGGALHHTVPRFPLYLPSALAVEAAAWMLGTDRRLRLALGAGALVGTIGLAGELAWASLSGWATSEMPVGLAVKVAALGSLAALAAGILGAGLVRAFSSGDARVPVGALMVAGIVLLGVLAYPLPRRVGHVDAVVRLAPVGARATVEVDLEPSNAADSATVFGVTAWQGGGRVFARLQRIGPGRYLTSQPVPVGGRWKTTVNLLSGDEVMAAPVYLPADPAIRAAAVPAVPERTVSFVRDTTLLLREKHPGASRVAVVAYSGLFLLVALWVSLMALVALQIGTPADPAGKQLTAVLHRVGLASPH